MKHIKSDAPVKPGNAKSEMYKVNHGYEKMTNRMH